jgi:uncharacterized protein (DUF1778 family)
MGVQCASIESAKILAVIVTKENRITRFSIRATARQKELIEKAARRSNKTISEFMLDNSVEAAEALELDNANFVFSRKDYRSFLATLDEKPKSIPALRKIFSEPSVIDDSRD